MSARARGTPDTLAQSLRGDFGSDDLPARALREPEGIRLVDCLAPSDPHVSDRLVASLDLPDVKTRLWAAHALSRRLPLKDAILLRLAADLGDPSDELRERLRWIFQVQTPLSSAVRSPRAWPRARRHDRAPRLRAQAAGLSLVSRLVDPGRPAGGDASDLRWPLPPPRAGGTSGRRSPR
jgi:hypothetical protein